MAVTIPGSAYQQVNESYALDANGVKTRRVQFKGTDFAALQNAANGVSLRDAYDGGYVLAGWELASVPGGGGVLTLSLMPSSGDNASSSAMRAVWTCKSVRNDVSILAFCGGSASRTNLELWQKEPSKELADKFTFHTDKINTSVLNSQEQEIAGKINNGVDSVIRFYSVLVCTSYWSRLPYDMMKKVGYIDSPTERSASSVDKPANLSTLFSSYSWLKVQDDVAEHSGIFVRTESWAGIPTDDGSGWDADLYGTNRWKMPLT